MKRNDAVFVIKQAYTAWLHRDEDSEASLASFIMERLEEAGLTLDIDGEVIDAE